MLRIERYLTGQLLRPVVGIFMMLLVLMLIFYTSRYLAEAAAEQFSLAVVGQLAFFKLALFLDVLLPVALFLGVVVGLGRLQSSYEITALAAAGTGRGVFLRAAGRIALVVLLLVAGLSALFRPWGYDRIYTLESELVARVDLELVEPGRFQAGDEEWLIYAESRRNDALEGVLVHQRLPQFRTILRAERLEQQSLPDGSMQLIFSGNVNSYRLESGGANDLVSRVDRLVVHFTPPEPVERERRRRALSFEELLEAGGPLEIGELQWRLLAPVSVVILALIAVIISRINPRQGQTARVLTASVLAALYFSTVGTLANWVDGEVIPMWPGLFWLPIVLVPLLVLRFWMKWRGAGPPL